MADEGFHEIQLTGKWLIFLSMTATVILVVVFLTGVMVGRGVRTPKDASTEVVTTTEPAQITPAPAPASATPPPVIASAPPTPADEDLTFPERLQDTPNAKGKPAAKPIEPAKDSKETKGAPAATPPASAAKPAAPAASAASPTAKPAAGPAAKPTEGDPSGPGFLVKVAALRERAQAEALVKKLSGSGYPAYLAPVSGKGLFSVRVGKYPTKKEAEAAKRRLEKDGFKPSISH